MPSPIEPLEPRRHFAAGDLDPSFGTGGTVTLRNGTVPKSGTPDTTATLLALDHAGRTLVVSSSYAAAQPEYPVRPTAYELTRLTADGRPDARFALPTGGAIPLNADQPPRKVLVDSQDRIYLITEDFVYHYTASGKIDRPVEASYAANDPSSPGNQYDWETGPGLLRTLPDGSVLAAFDSYNNAYPDDGGPTVHESGVVAFKFRPNGRVDRAYDSSGRAAYRWIGTETDIDDTNRARLAGLFDDGTVLVRDEPAHAAARYVTLTPAGHQDANVSFGSAVLPEAYVTDYTFHTQPDGRRLVFDHTLHTVRRYTASGTPDGTFNAGSPLRNVLAVALGHDNTLLTADTGRSTTDSRFVVRRFEL